MTNLCTILEGIVVLEIGPAVDGAPYDVGGGENAREDAAAMN